MSEQPISPDTGIEDGLPAGYFEDLHTVELTLAQLDMLAAGLGVMLGIYEVEAVNAKGQAMGMEMFTRILDFVGERS